MNNLKSHLILFTALSLAFTFFVGAYNLQKLAVLIPFAFMVSFASYITTEINQYKK
jgi:hypothetical protein